MRPIASIILIFAAAAGATIASRVTEGETRSGGREQQLVVAPTSSDAGAGLQLASFGVAELAPDDGTPIAVLHVRAVIANGNRDRPWSVDVSKARLDAVPASPVAPAFANANLTTLPIAIVDPGEQYMIDLYFPLPSELAARGGPTSFTVTWPVNTPDRVVRHAAFERARAVPRPYDERVRGAGWGPSWWFDPRYPWSTYHHEPGIATPRPPDRVLVTRPPRWDEPPPGLPPEERPRETECNDW